MIRGGCQQFKFKFPYNWDQISKVYMVVWQDGNDDATITITSKDAFSQNGCAHLNEVVTTLNQTQTLQFQDDKKAYVQVKILTTDGIAVQSKPKPLVVYPTKIDVVLTQ